MLILAEGPCPKCGRHGYWYGRNELEVMDHRMKGCTWCVLKWAIGRAFLIGIVTWIVVYGIMWYQTLP